MNMPLIEKALRGKLVIPEFGAFKEGIDNIYRECLSNKEGEVCVCVCVCVCLCETTYMYSCSR